MTCLLTKALSPTGEEDRRVEHEVGKEDAGEVVVVRVVCPCQVLAQNEDGVLAGTPGRDADIDR